MTHQDNDAKIIEPLAKFHARIDRDGRITIPRHVRAVFHINKDDYIKATIRRVYVDLGLKTIFILGEDSGVIMRVGRGGMVTIPQKIREELQLDPGDLVEIIIENIFKLKTGYEREFRYVREKNND